MKRATWATPVLWLASAVAAGAACTDPAAQGVDWSGCDFQSAELSDADLRGANLSGADFRDANLGGANLEGADITNTEFSHANLSRTVWTDGRTCGIGSDGECM